MKPPDILEKYARYFRKTHAPRLSKKDLLALYQAFFRAFNFGNEKYSILHASAAMTKSGKCILFGDDGNMTEGKTLLSLALASVSGSYVADEYVLYDCLDNRIFGNTSIPINLKGQTASFIAKQYGIFYNSNALIFADDYYSITHDCNVELMVIPYMNSPKTEIINPSITEQKEIIKATYYGHMTKFLNPEYDHVSVLVSELEKEIDLRKSLQECREILFPWPIIKVMIKDVEDIPAVIEELNKYLLSK